jgi:AraC-like DNA-binding protein
VGGAATIAATILQAFDTRLTDGGVDAHALGRACGVSDLAWVDGDIEIPLDRFVTVLERGAEACADPAFGWKAGPDFDLLRLGELGAAVLEAPTLGAALCTFSRYLAVVQTTSELNLTIGARDATFTYRILDPDIWPRQHDAEFSMAIMLSVMRRALGSLWRPERLTFEHRPSRAEQGWNEEIGAECVFGAETNAIVLPLGALDAPMPAADDRDWRQRASSLRRTLIERDNARSMASRVISAIYSALGKGPVDQASMARRLGVSARTLHRKLETEGTSFSEVVADCRFRIAARALADTRRSLAQIALDLGYSDQSAFTRAFRHHSGTTPGEYRERAHSV